MLAKTCLYIRLNCAMFNCPPTNVHREIRTRPRPVCLGIESGDDDDDVVYRLPLLRDPSPRCVVTFNK